MSTRGSEQGMTRFSIELPVLPAGALDRSEDVREPARLRGAWLSALMLPLGPEGQLPTRNGPDGPRLEFAPAADWGDEPVPDAVMLGSLGGVDYWTVPHWGPRGAGSGGATGADRNQDAPVLASMRAVGPLLSDTDAALAMTAVALTGWHTATPFCSRCGRPTVPDLSGHSRLCTAGHQEFPRTDPAVIVLVHDDDSHAVLARQPSWAPGRFSVLAGFAEAGESLEGTVVREIGEEVGVDVVDVEYLGSQPWPFPRSLMIAFSARAPRGAPLRPRPGEIADARWFSRDELREMVTESESWTEPASASRAAVGEVITLPSRMSIARRMVEGFVDAG